LVSAVPSAVPSCRRILVLPSGSDVVRLGPIGSGGVISHTASNVTSWQYHTVHNILRNRANLKKTNNLIIIFVWYKQVMFFQELCAFHAYSSADEDAHTDH